MTAKPEVERRIADQKWREEVENRLKDGESRMNKLNDDIAENTRITSEIKRDTADLITAFESVKGAFRVLELVGSLARPLSYITMFIGAVAGLWYTIKGGAK